MRSLRAVSSHFVEPILSPPKSTIYDLATHAGVSASTVSAILNGTWQARRISPDTAARVEQLANELHFSVNRQASGLRRQKSGLIGMMIPTHEDRFFGQLAQAFERLARERGLHPLVIGTLRDPVIEVKTVRTLVSYQVEHLIVTGATDPDAVSAVCTRHGIRQVNVDLPGSKAPSITTDNRWGAQQLTRELIARSNAAREGLHFVGGTRGEYATEERLRGFRQALKAAGLSLPDAHVHACGYGVDDAERAMKGLCTAPGGLPRAVLFASSITLEGAVRCLQHLPAKTLAACTFGSYDWNPFAALLAFPVHMVRQNVEGLMAEAFKVVDGQGVSAGEVVKVRPQLLLCERRP